VAAITRIERAKAWLREPASRWLLAVVGLAAVVRLVGIGHDLPHVYYPDEQHIVNRTVSLGGGSLNPHWFHKPAGLMYLLLVEFGAAFGVGRVFGVYHSTEDFALQYFDDPSLFYWIGRLTVCAFAIATIVVVWRLAKRRTSPGTATLAALLLALSVAHVYSSQEVKEDVPCTLFTTIAIALLVRVAETGRTRDLLAAGAFGGLAMATKYYALFLFPIAGAAAFLGRFDRGEASERSLAGDLRAFGGLVAFALVFQLVFFAASPFNFLDPEWYSVDFRPPIDRVLGERLGVGWLVTPFDLYFRASFTFESVATTLALLAAAAAAFVGLGRLLRGRGRIALRAGLPLAFVGVVALLSARSPRFRESVSWWRWVLFGDTGLGLLLAGASLLGVLAAAWRRRPIDLVIVAAAASYFVLAGLYEQPQGIAPRHLSVLYPIFAIATASLVADVAAWLARMLPRAAARALPAAVVLALLVEPSVTLAEHGVKNLRDDTRTIAKAWVEANVPDGSRLINDKEEVKVRAGSKVFRKLLRRLEKAKEGASASFTKERDRYYTYQMHAAERYRGPTYEMLVLDPPWWLYAEADYDPKQAQSMGDPLAIRIPKPIRVYRKHGFGWVITTSKSWVAYTREPLRTNFPSLARFYDELLAMPPVHVVPTEPWRNGPEVRVYDIR
jgi:dolichyl-phosphate-mannose-protein mannosyltransferase